MYLKLKQSTYDQLLEYANNFDMALASYINLILEENIIQQGNTTNERMDSTGITNGNSMD